MWAESLTAVQPFEALFTLAGKSFAISMERAVVGTSVPLAHVPPPPRLAEALAVDAVSSSRTMLRTRVSLAESPDPPMVTLARAVGHTYAVAVAVGTRDCLVACNASPKVITHTFSMLALPMLTRDVTHTVETIGAAPSRIAQTRAVHTHTMLQAQLITCVRTAVTARV